MNKMYSLVAACSLAASVLSAQELPDVVKAGNHDETKHEAYCSRMNFSKHQDELLARRPSAIVRRPYDVLSYNLFMDWRNPLTKTGVTAADIRYSGVNAIRVKIDSANTSKLTFNAGTMSIDSVFVDAVKNTQFTQPASGEFTITLPTAAQAGKEVLLNIYYTFTAGNEAGLYVYPKGMFIGKGPKGDSVVVEERLVYTMSEPEDARAWMPCNDQPYDKAMSVISVRVPDGFNVSANGLLDKITTETDGSKTFVWKNGFVIPTYLMVANASKFKVFSDWYKRVTNPNDSIEVQYYVWQKDYDGTATDASEYNAIYSFRNTPKMMEAYSKIYGEYPFEKYGMTSVQPFNFGGMEHQTLTTINRSWLRGRSESGIAHELMHQWTGDKVTCATWKDIWLNEGGATYGEALWAEAWGGDTEYKKFMRNVANNCIGVTQPIYAPPMSNIFNYATTYAKASWIYRMLRGILGDTQYFTSIRNYFERFKYASAESEDLLASLEQDLPSSMHPYLRIFFDQWVYQGGNPAYKLTASPGQPKNGEFPVVVTLSQTQTGAGVPTAFAMPVKITFNGAGGLREVRTMADTLRIQTETFTLPFAVTSVVVDENEDILCTKSASIISSVSEAGAKSESDIYPNPVAVGTSLTIDFSVASFEFVEVQIVDMLGNLVETLHSGYLPEGGYKARWENVTAAGVYMVRIRTNAGEVVKKIVVY